MWRKYKFIDCKDIDDAFENLTSEIECGGRIAKCGIRVEIVTAFALTLATAVDIAKNDPGRMPVAEAKAWVKFVIRYSSNVKPLFTNPDQMQAGFSAGMSFSDWEHTNWMLSLKSDNCISWRMGTPNEVECRMEFHEDPFNFLDSDWKRTRVTVRQFDDVDAIVLQLPEMETNAQFVSGAVLLNINASTWVFSLPAQIPRWGLVTAKIDRKHDNNATILSVPLVDFVFPPRFTNRVYDGK
jgi:hypothetical protein